MSTTTRKFLDNEKLLNLAIRILIALIILTAAALLAYRYYYYNIQLREKIPAYQALRQLEKEVRKNPLNINARIQLASAYIAVKQYDDAIQQCYEVLKVDKENQAAMVLAGFSYVEKGEYDEAIKILKKEIDTYSGAGFAMENRWLADAFFYTGVAYWKKKDLDKAIYHVSRAALIRRTDADTSFFLGRLYYEKKLYNNAETYFQRAISFDPKYIDAHYGLARVYERMDLLGMAVNEYERTYRLNPKLKDAKEKSDELFDKLSATVDKSPTVDNLIQLGYACMGRRDFVSAYKALDRAIRKEPENPSVYYALGYVVEREWAEQKDKNTVAAQKLKKKAEDYYKKTLELDPEYEGAMAGLKRIQLGIAEEEVIKRRIKVRGKG